MKMHLILAFALMMSEAQATSFFIEPFSQFTKTTSLIVRGTTTNIKAAHSVTEIGEKTIYTYADLNIRDVIKGTVSGSMIKIRRLGGTIDEITLEIPSSVVFKENEDGVFFLSEEREDHSYEVTGMELGKFNIEKSGGNEILKGGLFSYSQHADQDEGSQALQAGDLSENLKPWSITQLKELVRSQQTLPSENPVERKNTPVISSASSVKTEATPAQTSAPQFLPKNDAQPSLSADDAKDHSPLYFNSALWYALAILFLTLGVFTILRRR